MLDFLKLRPTTNAATDIAEALERARNAEAEAGPRVEAARKHRDDLLLDGDEKAIATAEKALAEAREDVERTHSVVTRLEERHGAAVRAERIGKAEAAAKVVEAADADLRKWWEKNAPSLRRILDEGHRLSVAVSNASGVAHMRVTTARSEYPDAEIPEGSGGYGEHRDWPKAVATLIEHGVQMPRAAVPAPLADEALTAAAPSGPGALVMGTQASPFSGSQAITFGKEIGL